MSPIGLHQCPPVCFLIIRVDESTDWHSDGTEDESTGLAVQLLTGNAREEES